MLGARVSAWDVADLEGLAASVVERTLRAWGCYLREADRQEALAYTLTEAWRLSGLAADGSLRQGFTLEVELDEGPRTLAFDTEALALDYLLRHEHRVLQRRGVAIRPGRPPGVFDPARGIAFSTYCSRLCGHRLVDWARSRWTDARYSNGRRPALSLDLLAESSQLSVDDYIGQVLDVAVEDEELEWVLERADAAPSLPPEDQQERWLALLEPVEEAAERSQAVAV